MKNLFQQYLIEEAKNQIEKYHLYHNNLHLEYERKKDRLTNIPPKKVFTPEEWQEDRLFNPFYILKNKKAIVNSVVKKLENGNYSPHKPYCKMIPKKGGGEREISIYQIPDKVVSKILFERLLKKNRHRFSSFSYAYRNDKNVHFAIQDIGLEFKKSPRMFIAEFDFSKFFDTISHKYLYEQFNENGFLISEFDEQIIKSFLNLNEKDVGIPQGTSISLFLANLVCWELDRSLEDLGIRFARYADDTVVWSNSYEKICKAFDTLYNFSVKSGIKINTKKSDGISLIAPSNYPFEMIGKKSSINFLGYEISSSKISIKDNAVGKLKKEINHILYQNLIQPLKAPSKNHYRPSNGKDRYFLRAVMQIRRYLYGNLTEYHLTQYSLGNLRKLKFKGLMSFYPLVDDDEQLKNLDKWLVSSILKTLKARFELLQPMKNQFPFYLTADTIIHECRNIKFFGGKKMLEIPSFLRINNIIRKSLLNEGIEYTMNPKANTYNY